MKLINIDKIPEIIDVWSKEFEVFVPVEGEDLKDFKLWDQKQKISLEGNVTVPPKKLFFPQTETLYKYKTEGQKIDINEIEEEIKKRIIFGIRPCDLKSLKILDDVFLTKNYVDNYYETKRKNTFLIAFLCSEACDSCFCTSLDIDPGEAPGADIVAFKAGEQLGLEAKSDMGNKLLESISYLIEEGTLEFKKADNFLLKANVDGLAEKLKDHFDSSYWEKAARRCLNCGTCTYLCPTCHCFDINSNTRGDHGIKTRCWDSCMFPEYTLMAGGHNPRNTKEARFRQRFLHKLQYFVERYGKTACVGCGRCIEYCPVNIDITRIISDLREVTGLESESN